MRKLLFRYNQPSQINKKQANKYQQIKSKAYNKIEVLTLYK